MQTALVSSVVEDIRDGALDTLGELLLQLLGNDGSVACSLGVALVSRVAGCGFGITRIGGRDTVGASGAGAGGVRYGVRARGPMRGGGRVRDWVVHCARHVC